MNRARLFLNGKLHKKVLILVSLAVLTLVLFVAVNAATPWAPNVAYKAGDIVSYNGNDYRCIQAHTSLVGWEPPVVPALWQLIGPSVSPSPSPVATPSPTRTPTPTRISNDWFYVYNNPPSNITSNSAVLSVSLYGSNAAAKLWYEYWETAIPSVIYKTSQKLYNLSYGWLRPEIDYTTITDLKANTNYTYRIYAYDYFLIRNFGGTTTYTFTTLAQ